MPSSSKVGSHQSAADSLHLFGSQSSPWHLNKQSQHPLPQREGIELESMAEQCLHGKPLHSQFQAQDSPSTLSTIQSHHEDGAATTGQKSYVQNVASQIGNCGSSRLSGESSMRPTVLLENGDYLTRDVQFEQKQSMAFMPYPWSESYFGGLVAAYGPNTIIYPQVVGITPGRVALPLDYTQGMPIYVNAKQYHAIIRRRQTRAKLEAQNKLTRRRKPYLHESRHLHALKRVRGSGGRFLNTKKTQEINSSSPTYTERISGQQIRGHVSEPELQHSESGSCGASTTSGSDVTSIFSGDDILQQPEFRVSGPTFLMGASVHAWGHSRDRLLLSID